MSGLAWMMQSRGAIVSGSDRAPSMLTDKLSNSGITVGFEQRTGELPDDCDLVVVSAAITPGHPEMTAAIARGLPVLAYAEALGKLMVGRTGVSIAGTHGKSTTTAMLAWVLIECGLDPSFIVGATCNQIGGGCRTGSDLIPNTHNIPGILLGEACEFNRSFHHHRPTVGAILNVEADHLDIYQTLDAVVEAFHEFAETLPSEKDGGYLLINHTEAHRLQVAAGLRCEIETIGLSSEADWVVRFDPNTTQITLSHKTKIVAQWKTQIPGEHNAGNAAAAAVLAYQLGCDDWHKIADALSRFEGVDRRMQFLGNRAIPGGSVRVYDDYGHHPTEIDATLRAIRAHEKPKRLVCVFQPHQHSRTRFLLEQFATSFSSADVVIVPHIYFVRDSEVEKQKVSASDLVDRLRSRGIRAMHLYPFGAIVEQLEVASEPGDLLVVMGAGPVWEVAHQFLGFD